MGITSPFRQCVYVPAYGYYWGVGIGDEYPPVIFIADDEGNVEVLGYAPYLCGPVVRIGLDKEHLHLVIRSPEGDELYYRLRRSDLSFDHPRGEIVTPDHREILYAHA